MRDDIYNPQIHCCKYWYKDFCDCVKVRAKEVKETNVQHTFDLLNKIDVNFYYSNVPNIVEINKNDEQIIYVSLKSEGFLYKVRFEGRAQWYTYSEKKLIQLLTQ